MGSRDVEVRIKGKEDVSKEAAKATGALGSLKNSAQKLFASDLFRFASFAGVLGGLKKASDAANELEASNRKLESTAKITGVSLDTLRAVSQRGQNAFKLNATLANEFSVELVKLAAKAGDVGKASAGLDAFLDLGAAKGLTASQTLTAVQQSILGIDEGTDKLFGKNPSAIWAEFATQIGTTVGRLSDQEKALALLTAVLEDGGKVRGEYIAWLQTSAGQMSQLTNLVNATAAEFGLAMAPSLRIIIGLLTPLVKAIGWTIQHLALLGVNLGNTFYQLPVLVQRASGETLGILGRLLQTASEYVPFFGERVAALGTELVKAGRRQVAIAKQTGEELLAGRQDLEDELLGVVRTSNVGQLTSTTTTESAKTEAVRKGGKDRQTIEEHDAEERKKAHDKWNKESLDQLAALGVRLGKIVAQQQAEDLANAKANAELLADALHVNLGEATAKALTLTNEAMEQLLATLKGQIPVEQWDALNSAVRQHKTSLADLLPPSELLAKAAQDAADANKQITEEQAKAIKTTGTLASDTATLARAFIDAASATGVIDAKMASILNSAISLAANIGKAFGGDPTAIAASVTSLANIIANVGTSETERRRQAASAANTQALDRLTREVGNLNLRESGKTFAGIQSAVDASIQARAEARASGKGPGAADEAAKAAFLKSLQSQGIGLEEARALFKELFGRDLALANAGTFFQDIQAFAEGLKQTEFGQFGSDFASQLDAVIKGFDIFGTDDADDKLAEFRDLAGRFSPALANALAGDLSTPEGRAQAAKNLQALFQKLKTGGLSPEEIGVSGNEFLSLIGAILPLLADANGVLGSGAAAAASVAAASPLGAPGLPSTTVGLGANAITSSVVGVPSSVTTINGGVNPTIIVQARPGETDDEFLRRIAGAVDEALLLRYDNLRAASGALASVNS